MGTTKVCLGIKVQMPHWFNLRKELLPFTKTLSWAYYCIFITIFLIIRYSEKIFNIKHEIRSLCETVLKISPVHLINSKQSWFQAGTGVTNRAKAVVELFKNRMNLNLFFKLQFCMPVVHHTSAFHHKRLLQIGCVLKVWTF